MLDDKHYTYNCKNPISIYENQRMSKAGKSVAIVAFENRLGEDDIITRNKCEHRLRNMETENEIIFTWFIRKKLRFLLTRLKNNECLTDAHK